MSASFNSTSEEQDLVNFLAKIDVDIQAIPQLRKDAATFRQDFLKKLASNT